jgi:hypothetical protein
METGGARIVNPGAVFRRDDPNDEVPDVAPAEQKEDEREQQKEGAGEDFDDRARGGQRTAGQLGLMGAQRFGEGVHGLVDLVTAEFGGSVDQPVTGAFDAAGDLLDELWCAFDELVDDEGENAAEDGETEDEDEGDGATSGGAVTVEEVDCGKGEGGEDERQCDGYDHDTEESKDFQEDVSGGEEKKEAPCPRRGRTDEGTDPVVGVVRSGWHGGVTALEPNFSATDRAADGTEDEQDDADDQENPADGDQQGQGQQVAGDEKDDSEDDHGQSDQ